MTLDPTLARLIAERLPGQRWGVYYLTGEGNYLPDGTEVRSGMVVAEDGRHYSFWMGWSYWHGSVMFEHWWQLDDDELVCALADWSGDSEYRAARRDAGLGDRIG